jgi:hypothetical protein
MTQHALVSLSSSSSTRLTPLGTHSGRDFTIQNVNDSGYIYIGGQEVTALNYGFRIMPNHAISVELTGRHGIYAIASGPDMKAAVLQTNLEVGS